MFRVIPIVLVLVLAASAASPLHCPAAGTETAGERHPHGHHGDDAPAAEHGAEHGAGGRCAFFTACAGVALPGVGLAAEATHAPPGPLRALAAWAPGGPDLSTEPPPPRLL